MPLFPPIPGETPIDDASGLKIKGITLRRELSVFEAENIAKVATKYLVGKLTRRKAPFDYSWALRLHREMFGKVWKWAGHLRTENLNLGVPYHLVETELFQLLESVPWWAGEPWMNQAARLHHQAVRIHPFQNGNGRWSRMLANIWLRLNGQHYTAWPEQTVGDESVIRGEYLAAIKAADQGEYGPLVELHKRFTPS